MMRMGKLQGLAEFSQSNPSPLPSTLSNTCMIPLANYLSMPLKVVDFICLCLEKPDQGEYCTITWSHECQCRICRTMYVYYQMCQGLSLMFSKHNICETLTDDMASRRSILLAKNNTGIFLLQISGY